VISKLIESSIRSRFLVCFLALLFIICGVYVASNSAVDVLPDFAPPQVIIQTEAPGMVAEEVEALVSLPLESALNGAPGIQHVKSISMTGISSITTIFSYGMDIYTCRQLVNASSLLWRDSQKGLERRPCFRLCR
jgi:Cu/Ag efflux pump CusA